MDQRKNKQINLKILWDGWKQKQNTLLVESSESSAKEKCIAVKTYERRDKISQSSNIAFVCKKTEKKKAI